MRMLLTTVAGLLWLSSMASAQPVRTFAELPLLLAIGDGVTIEDRSGAAAKGAVLRLTPEEIAISAKGVERRFSRTSVSRIQRRGDSLRNGMVIGATVGGALGGALGGAFSGEFRVGDFLQGVAIFGGVGLGVGLLLDAVHAGRTTVFIAPSMSARADRPDGGRLALHVTRRW